MPDKGSGSFFFYFNDVGVWASLVIFYQVIAIFYQHQVTLSIKAKINGKKLHSLLTPLGHTFECQQKCKLKNDIEKLYWSKLIHTFTNCLVSLSRQKYNRW